MLASRSSVLFFVLLALPCMAAPKPPAPEGADLAGKHAIIFGKPAARVPTAGMTDGPLLGNGDIGVVQAGSPDLLSFHIGKNDFWSLKRLLPLVVGQVRIVTPALKNATFHTEADLQLAETRGRFTQGDAELSTRSLVDANGSGFIQTLTNSGKQPLDITVHNIKSDEIRTATGPALVSPATKPALYGCEQSGKNRWFFKGAMADTQVLDRALSDEEIATLARAPRGEPQIFDGKTTRPANAPVIEKAMTFSAWIKPDELSKAGDYLFSSGAWNKSLSLGFSAGKLRFSLSGVTLQYRGTIPLREWTHVAAVYKDRTMRLHINGVAENNDAGASFHLDPDATPEGRKVGVSTRVLFKDGARSFTLQPGESATVATVILSDLDVKGADTLAAAKVQTAALTAGAVKQQIEAHRAWWRNYWSQSFIEIPDKVIEQNWYASQYTIASCCRAGKIAPGLWGNWITTNDSAWHGDYHLNYNFQAQFYGLYAANHTDETRPFYEAMNQSIPVGKRMAADRGWKGIHLPVALGPWGTLPYGERKDHGQRSNAAFAALPYFWYWNYTRDKEWLRKEGYAYVREVADFWEDYLKLENDRYVIVNDSVHEGSGPNTNAILSLGMVHALFENIVPMSEALDVDADKRAKWNEIRAKLSDFPTLERKGKTLFRYTSVGPAGWRDNTVGIQHIFPAGCIHLDSDPKLIEISHNMLDAMGRWSDPNGSASWYTACIRVGYKPAIVLKNLRTLFDKRSLPNKVLSFGGGGIENVAPSLAVTEMLFQSHARVLRFFPCWAKEQDARFGGIRAVGAFLVWAELKSGQISGVRIYSEKGLDCNLVNPWPQKTVQVIRNGRLAETVVGERFKIKTSTGESLELKAE
ncbi:hypothetical protein OKA05_14835 [Luteolibacter arcticus]|uniref:Glycosyl hydrolase family 95 catalytic domain-containing protein n=1 Tax=Luteolibacter arcticus TaxID=1581411 RepID=A0ABT3GK44_9BACT|nr:LamG-like jellyroll fold domain-containing protein [Luteolibacter arcticus]MCW1923841.1 hypothetical protein [Luteolibacter arcticus]